MLKQTLQQKLQQKLSPQQIQLMKLLQIPTIGLEQRIKEEMEINPALEEGEDEDDSNLDDLDNQEDDVTDADFDDDAPKDEKEEPELNDDEIDISDYLDDDDTPDYRYEVNNTSPDDEKKVIPFAGGNSFQEFMNSQIGMRNLDERQLIISSNIIGNIDDDGYMRRDIDAMVDDLAFTQNISTTAEELEHLLSIIQELDPAGVGARDLSECLLLQLKRKSPSREVHNAIRVIDETMDEFSKKHYEKVIKKLDITEDDLREAINVILKLNPKPGNSIAETSKTVQDVIPDFIIHNTGTALELSLNSRNAPALRVSRAYHDMMREYSDNKKAAGRQQIEALTFVKQKLDSAKWFIDAIKQRQETLLNTMQAIMEYQHEYFMEGDERLLKPMILKDIADIVHLDISTVSRVANSKYVQTPFGTLLLKSFFSESMETESGEEVSSKEVKKILEECVANENKRKPLPDDKLTAILKEKGYIIARRTVAKYREQLNIPVARLRKEF